MRTFKFLTLGTALLSSVALAQIVPADAIGLLDGVWHGEDRKIEIVVKGGVATVTTNASDDMYVKSLAMAPGTVIGRFTSFTQDGKRLIRLHGQCWMSGSRPQLGDCGVFNANLDLSMSDGKQVNRLKINTIKFARRADIPKYNWETRK